MKQTSQLVILFQTFALQHPQLPLKIISQQHSNLLDSISRLKNKISNISVNQIKNLKDKLKNKSALLRHPGEKLRETSQKLDNLELRMRDLLSNITLGKKGSLETSLSRLKSSSPLTLIKTQQK